MEVLKAAILRIVEVRPRINGSEVEQTLRLNGIKFQRGQERKALAALVEEGQLVVERGDKNAKLYSPPSVSPTSPTSPMGSLGTHPNPL